MLVSCETHTFPSCFQVLIQNNFPLLHVDSSGFWFEEIRFDLFQILILKVGVLLSVQREPCSEPVTQDSNPMILNSFSRIKPFREAIMDSRFPKKPYALVDFVFFPFPQV